MELMGNYLDNHDKTWIVNQILEMKNILAQKKLEMSSAIEQLKLINQLILLVVVLIATIGFEPAFTLPDKDRWTKSLSMLAFCISLATIVVVLIYSIYGKQADSLVKTSVQELSIALVPLIAAFYMAIIICVESWHGSVEEAVRSIWVMISGYENSSLAKPGVMPEARA